MENRFLLTPLFLDQPAPGLEALAQPTWRVNRPVLPEGDARARMAVVHEAIAVWVEETMSTGRRPVSIAGDCCTAIGLLAGLQRAGVRPALIWFDAHGDFNTPETTPSGFLGGMPLAMITGRGDLGMPAAVGLEPVAEKQIILTDGRDLDPAEKELLAFSEVLHLVNPADLLHHPLPAGPLYIHFDVDVVSLVESPAQNYPAAGGPSTDLLRTVFQRLARTRRIVAVSMATWNPALDPDRQSETVSMALLQALVGNVTP